MLTLVTPPVSVTRVISADPTRVGGFVAAQLGLRQGFSNFTALGLERDGRLIAGVVYTDYNPHNVFMHVAAEKGARWMTRRFLWACFDYPFVQMGVDRVTGWVEQSNAAARRFDEHLGFTLEATLQGAARDGSDVLLYRMQRHQCRFLGGRYVQSR